ncbi:MAG: glycosyltransferase N-terminal domain-containing protein, partial [Litorimonas sp.]
MTGWLKTTFAYRLVSSLLALVLPVWMRWRVRAGKEDAGRLAERYGRTEAFRRPGQLIWLHGASVGETQMLRPLIDRLLETPDRNVLITSGTLSSAQLIAGQLPERAIHQYVPLDTPRATARFIAYWHPDLAVFAESELWPNLIWTAKRAGTPLALINARMSQRSLSGWARRKAIALSVIGAFDTVLAADRRTADGLGQILGETVPMVGNLKSDAAPLEHDAAERDALKALIGDRPVWLAASTHEAEEEVFHGLHEALDDLFTLWLPRHPDRGEAIAYRTGLPRRSTGAPPSEAGYVMDTLGETGLALALADLCVMGGSFDPSLTGHNPLEAARAGVPVISGPWHESFADLYREMVAAGAVAIAEPDELSASVRQGIDGGLHDRAARARVFANAQSGALD